MLGYGNKKIKYTASANIRVKSEPKRKGRKKSFLDLSGIPFVIDCIMLSRMILSAS